MKKFIKASWSNIKWLATEIMNIYSNNPSFFSKKRIESGVAFIISQWGMIYWLTLKYQTMTTSDFIMWAGIEFAAAGYIVSQIQKEKKEEESEKETATDKQ
jgi:hypothetical protein